MAGSPHGKGAWNRGLLKGAALRSDFGRFGRLFPDLDQLTDIPEQALKDLAATMLDAGNGVDNKGIPSGYTYLGQFIDHDITLDVTTAGQRENDIDGLLDFRTPALDLDNVYGDGPGAQPSLYDRKDQRKLAVGKTGKGGAGDPGVQPIPNDLVRSREGLAVIGDPRNDENLVVAQTHLAFIKFHNKVVDQVAAANPAMSGDDVFAEARRTVTWHYQSIVLNDFLRRLIDPAVLDNVLQCGRKLFRFEYLGKYQQPFMPIEFSGAAYRLGHSMVRELYSYNRAFHSIDFKLLFQFTGKSGGIVGALAGDPGIADAVKPPLGFVTAELPGDWAIDWNRFYELNADDKPTPAGSVTPPRDPNTPPGPTGFILNLARPIDPLLAPALHDLPAGAGPGSLPFLNLLRGKNLGLPSGQDVAQAMRDADVDVPTLRPEDIAASGDDGAKAQALGLTDHTPLWYYILKEAQMLADSRHLGPVGSRILAEVFVGLLDGDQSSIRHKADWTPTLPSAEPGKFTMPDLLRFVDDLDPLNEPTSF